MKKIQKPISGLIAASAALFMAGCASENPSATTSVAAAEAKIHCGGVTTCKGTSDCKTAENACKGQNECKGHGFKSLSKAECDAAGGTVL